MKRDSLWKKDRNTLLQLIVCIAIFLHGQVSGIIMGVLGTAKRGTVTAEMSIKDNMRIFRFDSTEDELNIICARLNELYEHKRISEYKLIK